MLADDVQPEQLAKQTTGFSGADLENMVNQAALKATTDGMASVSQYYLEHSRDRIIMGWWFFSDCPLLLYNSFLCN